MQKVLLVGLGGALGSMLRYGLGGLVWRLKSGWSFPLETLLINVAGCLAIGFLAGYAEPRDSYPEATRVFLFVGLLGGFTTFSAFGYETFQLLRVGQWPSAMISAGLQVVVGVGAVWAGSSLARLV